MARLFCRSWNPFGGLKGTPKEHRCAFLFVCFFIYFLLFCFWGDANGILRQTGGAFWFSFQKPPKSAVPTPKKTLLEPPIFPLGTAVLSFCFLFANQKQKCRKYVSPYSPRPQGTAASWRCPGWSSGATPPTFGTSCGTSTERFVAPFGHRFF